MSARRFCEALRLTLLGAGFLGATGLSGCTAPQQLVAYPYEFPPVATLSRNCDSPPVAELQTGTEFETAETCARIHLGLQKTATPVDTYPQHTIGLTLSGGGTLSEPFEIGVLAGLQEAGVLENVDYISSVSGGSYAALYFYSHLLAILKPVGGEGSLTRAQMFWDCLPSKYATMFAPSGAPPDWSLGSTTGLCPHSVGQEGRYWPLSPKDDPIPWDDPLREASHLRGFQAIFDSGWAYDKYDGTLGDWHLWPELAGKLGINMLGISVPSFFVNDVFDWRLDFGYIKRAYDQGIARTYGETANDLQLNPAERMRTAGNSATLARLTFDNLRELYLTSNDSACTVTHATDGLCRTPLWIINSTSSSSKTFFPLTEFSQYNAAQNGFEMTAFGYGSSFFGRRVWGTNELEPGSSPSSRRAWEKSPQAPHPTLFTLQRAVGDSAAFMDSQQRQMGGPTWGPGINILLIQFGNSNWGDNLPNYHDRTVGEYYRLRAIHSVLLWPAYLFNYERETTDSLFIHLSDGGMTEDLGVAALLRRHVTDIIVADASSDEHYHLDDLCTLDTQLRHDPNDPRHIFIDIPGAPGRPLEGCAGTTTDDPYGIRNALWSPVIRGWVCKVDTRACTDETADARLYILKPALNLSAKTAAGISLSEARVQALTHQLNYAECASASDLNDPGYPCEVIAHLAGPASAAFPEDSMYAVQLSSNAYIFGAYKELGRFYARHLRVNSAPSEKTLTIQNSWVTACSATP